MGSTTYGGLLSPPYTRALRLFTLKIGRAELIEEIAQRTDSSKGEAQRYVETFEEVVAEALRGGDEIQITGIGKFYLREQKAREGVKPQTKEKMHIPASRVPTFSAGKGLKKTV
jgi:DNA-binding protein HU-beta